MQGIDLYHGDCLDVMKTISPKSIDMTLCDLPYGKGDTPDGYTWHHDAEAGKMQLVDTETHQKTGHTGGRSIWGGGTESR